MSQKKNVKVKTQEESSVLTFCTLYLSTNDKSSVFFNELVEKVNPENQLFFIKILKSDFKDCLLESKGKFDSEIPWAKEAPKFSKEKTLEDKIGAMEMSILLDAVIQRKTEEFKSKTKKFEEERLKEEKGQKKNKKQKSENKEDEESEILKIEPPKLLKTVKFPKFLEDYEQIKGTFSCEFDFVFVLEDYLEFRNLDRQACSGLQQLFQKIDFFIDLKLERFFVEEEFNHLKIMNEKTMEAEEDKYQEFICRHPFEPSLQISQKQQFLGKYYKEEFYALQTTHLFDFSVLYKITGNVNIFDSSYLHLTNYSVLVLILVVVNNSFLKS